MAEEFVQAYHSRSWRDDAPDSWLERVEVLASGQFGRRLRQRYDVGDTGWGEFVDNRAHSTVTVEQAVAARTQSKDAPVKVQVRYTVRSQSREDFQVLGDGSYSRLLTIERDPERGAPVISAMEDVVATGW